MADEEEKHQDTTTTEEEEEEEKKEENTSEEEEEEESEKEELKKDDNNNEEDDEDLPPWKLRLRRLRKRYFFRRILNGTNIALFISVQAISIMLMVYAMLYYGGVSHSFFNDTTNDFLLYITREYLASCR